jgi:hypothetical protein
MDILDTVFDEDMRFEAGATLQVLPGLLLLGNNRVVSHANLVPFESFVIVKASASTEQSSSA